MSLRHWQHEADHVAGGLQELGDELGELLDTLRRQVDRGDAHLRPVETRRDGLAREVRSLTTQAVDLSDDIDHAVEELEDEEDD
jgi:hypothetical protein